MSGIYIPGMEVPDRCFSCPLCNIETNGESSCAKSLGPVIEYKEIDVETAIDTRPDWCSLVPVPEHGDLIDRDKLEKDIERYVGGEESRSRFHHLVQVQRSVISKDNEVQT